VRYSGHYLRRSSAEAAFRVCQRRGWEPTLDRRFGVWVVGVRIDAPAPAAAAARQPALRTRQPA
jgi:hypothetical protein